MGAAKQHTEMTMAMTEPTWLEMLKAGDAVIVNQPWSDGYVARVERVTATQIIVGTTRFNKLRGYEVGSGSRWGAGAWIVEATAVRAAQVREATHRKSLTERIRQTSWKDQPTDVLEAVALALGLTAPAPQAADRAGRAGA